MKWNAIRTVALVIAAACAVPTVTQAQLVNLIAAQQSLLVKWAQSQQIIDASSDEVRAFISKAQSSFAAAAKRQAELSSQNWSCTAAEPLKLGAALGFAYDTSRIIGTPVKQYSFGALVISMLELNEAVKACAAGDPKTLQLLNDIATHLNSAKSAAIRLTQAITDKGQLIAEAQGKGFLPGLTFDSKTGAFNLALTSQAATPTTAAAAPASEGEMRFGSWKVIVDKGRPVAMTVRNGPASTDGDGLAGVRLECNAGKLQYAPVSLKGIFQPTRALQLHGVDDSMYDIPLTNGRVIGPDNATLSKEFAMMEGFAKRDKQATWMAEMGINGPERPMQEIKMTGFSQMRVYMLANCKN